MFTKYSSFKVTIIAYVYFSSAHKESMFHHIHPDGTCFLTKYIQHRVDCYHQLTASTLHLKCRCKGVPTMRSRWVFLVKRLKTDSTCLPIIFQPETMRNDHHPRASFHGGFQFNVHCQRRHPPDLWSNQYSPLVGYLEKGYYSFTQPFEAFPKSLQGAFFAAL